MIYNMKKRFILKPRTSYLPIRRQLPTRLKETLSRCTLSLARSKLSPKYSRLLNSHQNRSL